jgi:hypothetical protein
MDPDLLAEETLITPDDQRRHNGVEGKFCQGKRRFGLDLIREELVETSGCTIAMNLLVMKLEKLLELLVVLITDVSWFKMATFASERRITLLSSSRPCNA